MVRLDPLFDGQLEFEGGAHLSMTPPHADNVGYAFGHGTVRGARLTGKVRWTNTPRRREDGVWLPHFNGLIETHDEAKVLFDFFGYNVSRTAPHEYTQRQVFAAITFQTNDDRYRWLNLVFGLLEAEVAKTKGEPERWRISVHECARD